MNDEHPILQHFRGRVGYMAIWLSVSIVQAILISLFGVRIALGVALIDALIFNALFAIGILPLWYPVRYHSPKYRSHLRSLPRQTPAPRITLSHTPSPNLQLPQATSPHITSSHTSLSYTSFPYTFIAYTLLAGILIVSWIAAGNHLIQWLISHPDYHTFLHLSTGWRIVQGALFFVIVILFFTRHAHVAALTEEVATLQQTIDRQKGEVTRISVKERQQIHIIAIEEIEYLEAYGDYIQLHTAKGTFLKEHTMKFIEERLPSTQFVRIHRSYIVNIQYVAKIELYEKEHYRVHLKNGKIIKTSDAGYKLIRTYL